MQNALQYTVRSIAPVLSLALTLNQLAYAADLPDSPSPAQNTPAPTPPANPPAVPAQIRNARSIFLANAGSSSSFPGAADQAYTQFYNDLHEWGHFQIVDAPAAADLIFQLRSASPIGGVVVVDGTGSSYRSPTLVLSIIDPKTQTLLWSMSNPLFTALNKSDKNDWFSISVLDLTTRVKLLVGAPVTQQESAYLAESPQYHHSKLLLLWLLVPAAIAGGTVAIVIHEKDKYNNFATQNGLTCATNTFFCTNP